MSYKKFLVLLFMVLMPIAALCGDLSQDFVDAAQKGDAVAVKRLLTQDVDVNAKDEFFGRTVLMYAATGGYIDVVRVLLEKGADVNAQDNIGMTALMWAVYDSYDTMSEGHAATVRALLDSGANVNVKENNGEMALMIAVYKRNISAIQLLLASGADADAKNEDGITSLMLAAIKGYADVARVLVAAGADIHIRDNKGKTAWVHAAQMFDTEVMELLEAVGARREYQYMEWEGWESHQGERLIKVIIDEEEWEELWKRALGKQAPYVDFEHYAVACVFLGHEEPNLYAIEFLKPLVEGSRMIIPFKMHYIKDARRGPLLGDERRFFKKILGQYHMKVFKKAKGVEMVLKQASWYWPDMPVIPAK